VIFLDFDKAYAVNALKKRLIVVPKTVLSIVTPNALMMGEFGVRIYL
jgi:hypothetical protein